MREGDWCGGWFDDEGVTVVITAVVLVVVAVTVVVMALVDWALVVVGAGVN